MEYTIHDIQPNTINPWKININLEQLYECLSKPHTNYGFISTLNIRMMRIEDYIDVYKLDKTKISLLFINKCSQTEECCFAAVKRRGGELSYVREDLRTPEICLAAVKHDGYAISKVTNKTPEICLAAVKQTPFALQFMNEYEQTEEICLEAVSKEGSILFYVRNQTTKIIDVALSQNKNAYKCIKIKCKDD